MERPRTGPVAVPADERWLCEVDRLLARGHRGDPGELIERLRRWIDVEDELERRLGRVLARLGASGAWRELWFDGPGHYARERLGLARTTAEDRVRLARGLGRLPALRQSYEEGRLGLEATLLLRRLLADGPADAEVVRAWVAHAEGVTVRRLRDEVRLRRRERALRPPAAGDAGPPTGRDSEGPPGDREWYASLAREPGTSRDRLAVLGRMLDGRTEPDVFMRLRLPADVAEALVRAIEAARADLAARVDRAPWDEAWPDPAAPASLRVARTFSLRSRRVPSWVGLLALLEEFVAVWDPPEQAGRRRAEAVYRRAGWRCEVPGCTSRSNLEDHHMVYRSRGGGNGLRDRICECRLHHHQGEHGGLVRSSGEAPLGLVWRLGSPRWATWWANDRRLTPRERPASQ
jgi:hypothetical protein